MPGKYPGIRPVYVLAYILCQQFLIKTSSKDVNSTKAAQQRHKIVNNVVQLVNQAEQYW